MVCRAEWSGRLAFIAVLSLVVVGTGCDGDDAPIQEAVGPQTVGDRPAMPEERMPEQPLPAVYDLEFGPDVVAADEIPEQPVQAVLGGEETEVEKVEIETMSEQALAQTQFEAGFLTTFELTGDSRIILTIPFELLPGEHGANAGTIEDWNEAARVGTITHPVADGLDGETVNHGMNDAWSVSFQIEGIDPDERDARGRVYLAYAGDEDCEIGPTMLVGAFEAGLSESTELDW